MYIVYFKKKLHAGKKIYICLYILKGNKMLVIICMFVYFKRKQSAGKIYMFIYFIGKINAGKYIYVYIFKKEKGVLVNIYCLYILKEIWNADRMSIGWSL